MSRILKVSQSDYRVKVQDGGTITLDTGAEQGTVVITGDLTVLGNSTSIDTTNMVVQDNILVINREVDSAGNPITHTGVTLGQAGIEVDRGTLSNAQFLFDESVQHYDPLTATTKAGTFVFKTKDGALSGIQVSSISTSVSSDLTFDLQNTSNMLTIANVTDYASRVVADNHIPNKKYIDDYVASGIIVPGMADVDRIYFALLGVEKARVQATASNIQFAVAQNQRAQITGNGLDVDDINLFNHTITSSGTYNLILTAANNNVEVNAILNLDDQSGAVSGTGGKNKIYSTAISSVRDSSGVFFANNVKADELVARNRALLFSMLF
ncbi:hypothetical protein UFOVP181_352 [uncultured Caudovirales phage]|uniref:Uncharacterized protein n=1 Tax=uncultured Caudovirales phage TaxID=2100421 RepID=A0A6J5KXZ2_9CAUD|nr:hypothetical protein UFOVP57_287 [uncultured Caudovirales phage]CAB5209193.1 hypothetical protein UFOVP181_352 [uncultured Caudovirales phage]